MPDLKGVKVASFFQDDGRGWDAFKLSQVYPQDTLKTIIVLISKFGVYDRQVMTSHFTGVYSCKYGYEWLCQQEAQHTSVVRRIIYR